jgi:hypothetical protein
MKHFCLFLIASLLFATNNFAQTGGTTGSLTWSLSDDGTLTISGTGEMPDYNLIAAKLPTSSDPTYIAPSTTSPWFSFSELIKSIVIEEGIMKIGDDAFSFCYNLTSVTLPEGLSGIGKRAFASCHNLESIDFPESLNYVDDYAFTESLNSLTISAHLHRIGANAFDFRRFTSIHVDEDNPIYYSEDGVFYMAESDRRDKFVLIAYPGKKTDNTFVVPENVIAINEGAFRESGFLRSVVIPEHITKIENRMFENSAGLTSVTMSENVTDIGDFAFAGTAVSAVSIPNVSHIGKGAFSHCGNLLSVDLPAGLTEIEQETFRESGLQSVVIPEGVESIGLFAFSHCLRLSSVKIPESVTFIDSYAFFKAENVDVNWPSPLVISGDIFGENADLSANTLTVPAGTKQIYEAAPVWQDFGTIVEKAPYPEYYYWYKGEKQPLVLLPTKKYISVASPNDTLALKSRVAEQGIHINKFWIMKSITGNFDICWAMLEGENLPDFMNDESVLYEGEYFQRKGGYGGFRNVGAVDEEFSLSVPQAEHIPLIEDLARENNIAIIKSFLQTLVLSCTKQSKMNPMQIGNLIYENGWSDHVELGFVEDGYDYGATSVQELNKENIVLTPVSQGISIETKENTPVAIYNLLGVNVYQAILDGSATIRLGQGIYVVKANGKGTKIIIK